MRILLKFIFFLIKTSCLTPLTWISRAVQAIYLEISAGIANLVDVGQRTPIVLGTVLRQTELLEFLKLHLQNNKEGNYQTFYSQFIFITTEFGKQSLQNSFHNNLKTKPWEEKFLGIGKAAQIYAMRVSEKGQSTVCTTMYCRVLDKDVNDQFWSGINKSIPCSMQRTKFELPVCQQNGLILKHGALACGTWHSKLGCSS